jgi:hypothetical protein
MNAKITLILAAAALLAMSLAACERSPTSPSGRRSLSVDDTTVAEGHAAVFTIRLSSAATRDVTVDVETEDGSATAPDDYTAVDGTVTVAAGTTAVTVEVPVLDDGAMEDQECFSIQLSHPEGAVIDDSVGVATIERYPLRDTPDDVLEKLRLSYIYMDADAYLDCLAEDFIFYLNPDDLTPESGLPEYWGKGAEDTIAHNMFGDGTPIDSIGLALSLVGSPDEIPGPPPSWEYRENVDLRVYLEYITYLAGEGEIYVIGIDPNDVGPTGEELWEIVEWYDVEEFRGTGSVEDASWGVIKSLFR